MKKPKDSQTIKENLDVSNCGVTSTQLDVNDLENSVETNDCETKSLHNTKDFSLSSCTALNNKNSTRYMDLEESINVDILHYIVNNFSTFKSEIKWKDRYDIVEPTKIIKSYLKKSTGGATASWASGYQRNKRA